jgi:hypothetical protein
LEKEVSDEYIYFPYSIEEALLNILDVMQWNNENCDDPKAVVMTHDLMCDLLQRFLVLEQAVRGD